MQGNNSFKLKDCFLFINSEILTFYSVMLVISVTIAINVKFLIFFFNNPVLFLHVNLLLMYLKGFRKCHWVYKYLSLNFVQFVQCSLLSLAKALHYSLSSTDIISDASTKHQQGIKNNMIFPVF